MILFLGSGFIANAFSSLLNERNIPHRTISRDCDHDPPTLIRGELADLTVDSPLFDGVTTAFYFAHSSVPYSSMQDIRRDAEENILTAIRLFDILSKRNIRVVYVSSGGSIYGVQEGPISEQTLPEPISAYGVSKYAIENYMKVFQHNHGLKYDILRFSNVYGVGQKDNRPQGVVYFLARAFTLREKFEVWGDGSAAKDYLYVDDAARALAVVAAAEPSNDIFNVSYGESISIRAMISLFEELFGYGIEIGEKRAYSFDVQNVQLDNTKFTRAYDWSPAVDIKTGIRQTTEWVASERKKSS